MPAALNRYGLGLVGFLTALVALSVWLFEALRDARLELHAGFVEISMYVLFGFLVLLVLRYLGLLWFSYLNHLDEERLDPAAPVQSPDAARVPQIGEQERAVAHQRDAVRPQVEPGVPREPGLLASIGRDAGDAAAPVRHHHAVGAVRDHALRPVQVDANRLECIGRDSWLL